MPYEIIWTAKDGHELYEFYQRVDLASSRAVKLMQEGRAVTVRDKSNGAVHRGEAILDLCNTVNLTRVDVKPNA